MKLVLLRTYLNCDDNYTVWTNDNNTRERRSFGRSFKRVMICVSASSTNPQRRGGGRQSSVFRQREIASERWPLGPQDAHGRS